MKEVIIDGTDADFDGIVEGPEVTKAPKAEPMVKAKTAGKALRAGVAAIRSPLVYSESDLRERAGYHQTWLRPETVDKYKQLGYSNIRKQHPDKAKERPGAETGEIVKRSEGENQWLYALEVPLELYEQHIAAMSALSHARYTGEVDLLREYTEGKNRDLGSALEVLTEQDGFEGNEKFV